MGIYVNAHSGDTGLLLLLTDGRRFRSSLSYITDTTLSSHYELTGGNVPSNLDPDTWPLFPVLLYCNSRNYT